MSTNRAFLVGFIVTIYSVFGYSQIHTNLVWADEFEVDGKPDPTKWGYDLGNACDLPCGCGWGNNELQIYTDDLANAKVENGCLVVSVLEVEPDSFTSARIHTKGKTDWTYGTFEIRAKVATGLGTWSAIWMLPTENKYGGWPKSGEIDIMENVGYASDSIVGSSHTESYNHMIGTHKNGELYVPDATTEYHIYKNVWTEEYFALFVDDTELFRYVKESEESNVWPYDEPFYFLINLAYGGNWGGKMGIAPAELPADLIVDYVRVYQ